MINAQKFRMKKILTCLTLTLGLALFAAAATPSAAWAAADGTPQVSGVTMTPYYNHDAGSAAAYNLSQKLTVDVALDEAVRLTPGANLKNYFNVTVYGYPVGTGAGAMAAVDLDVQKVDNRTIRFVLSSNSDLDPNTANPFFGVRGANLTITAANGSTIPCLTAIARPYGALVWDNTTFADKLINLGLDLSNAAPMPATADTGSSVTVTVNNSPQIRGASWMKIKITHSDNTVTYDTNATTPTIQMMPTIPAVAAGCLAVHSQFFYNMTNATTATAIYNAILDPNSGVSGRYTVSHSGDTVMLTQAAGTYDVGDKIELIPWDYTK